MMARLTGPGAALTLTLALGPAWAEIPDASGDCAAGLPESTPSDEFTVPGGGETVRHEATGLEWQRCSLGQAWDGEGCAGGAGTYLWQVALQEAASQGWRLPNINELGSIVEECRTGPAINQAVFPDTPAGGFLSASPSLNFASSVRGVDFDQGGDGHYSVNVGFHVRLVRDP